MWPQLNRPKGRHFTVAGVLQRVLHGSERPWSATLPSRLGSGSAIHGPVGKRSGQGIRAYLPVVMFYVTGPPPEAAASKR